MSPAGKFQQNLFYMFSQFDNELRRDKTKTGMAELIRKGYWLWTPPRGYKNNNAYKKAVDWDIVITKEGELLKKAFKWKVKGMYSNAEIARKLSGLGMRINEKRLLEIFKNPFYCGILVTKMLPGEVHEGNHPKIVSREDFLRINTISSTHPEKHISENDELPLKQFAVCNSCKTPLTGFEVKTKGLYYYKCPTSGCIGTKSAKKLHVLFLDTIKKLEVNNDIVEFIPEIMQYLYTMISKDKRSNEAEIKKRLSIIQSKLHTLEERFAIGEINNELFRKFEQQYSDEIRFLEQEIEGLEISSSNLDSAIEKTLEMCSKLSEIWTYVNLKQKLQFQKLLFPDGIGYDKHLDRVQTFRINSVFATISSFTTGLLKEKSGYSINFDQISALVTSTGDCSNFLEDIKFFIK